MRANLKDTIPSDWTRRLLDKADVPKLRLIETELFVANSASNGPHC